MPVGYLHGTVVYSNSLDAVSWAKIKNSLGLSRWGCDRGGLRVAIEQEKKSQIWFLDVQLAPALPGGSVVGLTWIFLSSLRCTIFLVQYTTEASCLSLV